MKEAIADGYILDPTKHIIPVPAKMYFELPNGVMQAITAAMNSGQDERVSFAKKQIYENPDRMKAIAEFVVNRLLSLVYGKIRGTGKAMLAVSSIPIAIQYCKIIRQLMAEKTASGTFAKYADAPVAIVYSDNQKYEKCSSMNGGVAEDKVIDNFKTAKNGLIIVVDKLQTGFDEPKLHTLFLDKEIRDINAIQTISRVNRKTKYKEECHIIDFSFGNVNEKNIRDAFAKFCGMVITDFDPLREKAIIQELYRELLAQPIYIKWFERYKSSVNNAEANAQLCLDMDADIRAWIKNVMEAHAQYTQDLKTHSEETASTSDDDPAKALRKTIGRYNSLLVLLQGVIELDAQFKDAVFIDFWQRYCNIYRSLFEQQDSIGSIRTTFDGEIGLLVSDEVEIEEPQDQDDAPENSRSKKNTGENRGGPAPAAGALGGYAPAAPGCPHQAGPAAPAAVGGVPPPPDHCQAEGPGQHPGGPGSLPGPPGDSQGPDRRGPGSPYGGGPAAAGAAPGSGGRHPRPHGQAVPSVPADPAGQSLRHRQGLFRGAGIPAEAGRPPGGRQVSAQRHSLSAVPLFVRCQEGRGAFPSPAGGEGGKFRIRRMASAYTAMLTMGPRMSEMGSA